ncbi:transmembrane protein 18-like isoform X1 [Hydractinia symbiolongicarpus]|uniref:transmembrane protein 18-like isoform X1 n=2 Tax=Hydractinia symbiolongicarpus TaxID=13093 RepID=UPI002550EFA8|nr:transmembrane protein 18-like isoform X1 [Hydractinia symbiolongicarpus]XP_057310126.1 transmembrane protein 18-like isoform X1 [Hydractinia symbiolongicarpus]
MGRRRHTTIKMADDKVPRKPSLFMSAFQEIHERLARQYGNDEERKVPPRRSQHSSGMPNHFTRQVDNYWDFIKAIPWFEPWLVALMVFHLLCFVVVVASGKHYNTQYVIFFSLLVLVYLSEKLNEYSAENWKLFAKENYFDSNGLFTSTVFSAPILFNCICLIILWLRAAADAMIEIKKRQIIDEYERERKAKGEDESKKKK